MSAALARALTGRFTPVVTALAVVVIALWLWQCWCIFPSLLFNEVRLEPSFLLANGTTIYPGPGNGPVTTWIYGPLTPLLFLPSTLAASASSALMVAGAINLFTVVGSLSLVCALWPAPAGSTLTAFERFLAVLVCIVVWPGSSLQDIQADNTAVAFGLIGNLLLIRNQSGCSSARWLAAGFAVAAIACKQTAGGALLAQIIWLGWREGWRAGFVHAARGASVGIGLVLASLAYFGPEGLWLNLIVIPSRLPWTDEWLNRIQVLAPYIAVHIAAPMLILLLARRSIWNRDSPLLLPALSWFAALPPGLAAVFKIGGTLNSLESLLLFLPPAVLTFVALQKKSRWSPVGFAAGALGIAVLRLNVSLGPKWRPRIAHLHEAETLAAQMPGQIWFPWNPLVTFYSDHRFDHVEDGIFVRFVTGKSLTMAEARAYLPPHWHGMALRSGSPDWGLAVHLCPTDAEMKAVGRWTLYTWPAKLPSK